MLTIYRRHRKACSRRADGRAYRRCQCPVWVDGLLGGKEIRQSLRLRDWQKAQARIREWEAKDRIEQDVRATVAEAWNRFLADAEARKLRAGTLGKYKSLRRQMESFAVNQRIKFLDEFSLDTLGDFRAGIGGAALNRLRAFFRVAFERRWIPDNPARVLRPAKIQRRQTMPFSAEEMGKILGAVEGYAQYAGRDYAHRLRSFVLLLRYSGMRIGDAAQLKPNRIVNGRLFLYTQKTGQPVNILLPGFLGRELVTCPRGANGHFFWSGASTVKTAVSLWQRRLASLFRRAEVKGGHAHRFRDTFAVEFLMAGGTMEQLSVLLGHSSTRITERHYAPWVEARQQQLDSFLKRTWARDPLALAAARGTRGVHGGKHVN